MDFSIETKKLRSLAVVIQQSKKHSILSNICSEVVLVHRRDSLRAEKMLQDKLFEREREGNISIEWNHNPKRSIR